MSFFKKNREILLFLRDISLIIVLVFGFIKPFVMSPFLIRGHSMESSFHDGEFIIVNKWSYAQIKIPEAIDWRIGNPLRGDVVVLEPHVSKQKTYYIKRVIGLPGDTIRIASGSVYITPEGADREILLDEEAYLNDLNNGQTKLPSNVSQNTFVIPSDSYWVMGDNRNNSSDSRQCFLTCVPGGAGHFVERSNIVGKPLVSFGGFSISRSKNNDGGTSLLPSITQKVDIRGINIPKEHTYNELTK